MLATTHSSTSLFRKLVFVFFAFAGIPFVSVIFMLAFVNVNKADNANEVLLLETGVSIAYIGVPVLILLATAIWHLAERSSIRKGHEFDNEKWKNYAITSCRYFLATIMIYYGSAKLVGDGQFHTSFLDYGEEIGRIRGSLLAWTFFSYSPAYNVFIAVAEVVGGSLLLFRRTVFYGSLFLLPVLINIFAIDFTFDISAKDIITVLVMMNLFLLSLVIRPLIIFFFYQRPVDPRVFVYAYSHSEQRNGYPKFIALAAIVIFALATTWQNRNIKFSTLEGAWYSVSVTNFTDSVPEKSDKLRLSLFIDDDMATIKKVYQYQDFNISFEDPSSVFTLTSKRDTAGLNVIRANYVLAGKDSLVITGMDGPDSVRWILKRRDRH